MTISILIKGPTKSVVISEEAFKLYTSLKYKMANIHVTTRIMDIEEDIKFKSAVIESIKARIQNDRQCINRLEKDKKDLRKEKDELEKDRQLIIAKIQQQAASIGLDIEKSYNVAIAGQSGCGKSTLINYLCGYKDDHPEAAEVNVVECTQKMKKYIQPNLKQVVFWDCPGGGTQAHPMETYFEDKMLYLFDFLVILFTERFKEIDASLIKNAIKYKIPIAVVRNKANNDLTALKRRDECINLFEAIAKEKLIEKLRQDTKTCLSQLGVVDIPKIFIINSWALDDKDQPQFEEAQLLEHVATVIGERRKK